MGIGNTTAAAAIVCATSGLTPAEAAGRGTGIDEPALHTKTTVIDRALHLHNPDPHDGIDIIHKVGGYEIAAMAGAAIGGAANGVIVVLDGLISTAAGCIASLLAPAYLDYCMVGHASAEPAHKAACLFLGKTPILDVQMRLGEGTGAVLAMDIIDAACCLQRDMASFDDAGVSQG
jgi:nicotinate-nucleotide--dimethylbenzimidazole phosphoribosyltransferase